MGNNNQGTDYNLGGDVIPCGKEEKDLGVIITEDGKYHIVSNVQQQQTRRCAS